MGSNIFPAFWNFFWNFEFSNLHSSLKAFYIRITLTQVSVCDGHDIIVL